MKIDYTEYCEREGFPTLKITIMEEKQMKKIIALLLVLAMALALVACGASEPAATEAPKADVPAEAPKADAPAAEPKKYEGVELTYWSMWSAGEPQALVIEATFCRILSCRICIK